MSKRYSLALVSLLFALILALPLSVQAAAGSMSVSVNDCTVHIEVTPTAPGEFAVVVWVPPDGYPVYWEEKWTDDGSLTQRSFDVPLTDGVQYEAILWDVDTFTRLQDQPVACETDDGGGDDGGGDDGGGDDGGGDDDGEGPGGNPGSGGNPNQGNRESDEDSGPVAGPPFNSGDARINMHAGAPAAVFCNGDSIEVYGIDSNNGEGWLALDVTFDEMFAAPAGTNTLMGSNGGIALYHMSDGRWAVRAAQADGKTYEFAFGGCPYPHDGVASVW